LQKTEDETILNENNNSCRLNHGRRPRRDDNKQAHMILGHLNRLQILETEKKYGWKIKDLNEAVIYERCQMAIGYKYGIKKQV
jgi:hypothetical protein